MNFSARNSMSLVVIMISITFLLIIPYQVNDNIENYFSGAQLIPKLSVLVIFFLSALDLFLNNFFSKIKEGNQSSIQTNYVPFGYFDFLALALITGSFISFVVFLPFLGYLITSFILVMFLFFINGGRKFFILSSLAVGAVGSMYCCMRYLFGIHLQVYPSFSF